MKKSWLLILICTLLQFLTNAQHTDLASLSSGELKTFHVLTDSKGKIFGYLLVYDKGIVPKQNKEFEFAVLDKNLRQLISNTVIGPVYVVTYSGYLDYNNDLILYPRLREDAAKSHAKLQLPKNYKVQLKDNTVSEWADFCFENQQIVSCDQSGTFKDLKEDEKKEKKAKGFVYESSVYKGDYGGYLVIEYDDYGKYNKNFTIRRFDDNKQEQWVHTITDEVTKKHFYFVRIVHIDSTKLFGFKVFVNKNKYESCHFMAWDMKNGNLLKEELVEDVAPESIVSMLFLNAEGLSSYVDSYKAFDDKIVGTGRITKWNGLNSADRGYFRCIIDKSSLKLTYDKLYFNPDFKTYFPKITEYGDLEKGFNLSIRDAFFLADGSIIYIFEKYKYDSGFFQGYSQKNDDLVFVITDADFKIKNVKIMYKEKSVYSASDYLFGQYLHDGKDFAFFYQDFKKGTEADEDENWVLFINTWIDGQLNEEQLKITSEKNAIYPYIAKEGYILLREYNEKAKYNQIRLEKLNF